MLTLMGDYDSVNLFSSRKPLLGWIVILHAFGQLWMPVSPHRANKHLYFVLLHRFRSRFSQVSDHGALSSEPFKPDILIYLPSYPAILLWRIRTWVLAAGSSILEQPLSGFLSLSSPQECSANSGWKGKTGRHSVELGFLFLRAQLAYICTQDHTMLYILRKILLFLCFPQAYSSLSSNLTSKEKNTKDLITILYIKRMDFRTKNSSRPRIGGALAGFVF